MLSDDGIVDIEERRQRRSSLWSMASSHGEGRKASIVKAAAAVFGRKSSVGEDEMATKGEE